MLTCSTHDHMTSCEYTPIKYRIVESVGGRNHWRINGQLLPQIYEIFNICILFGDHYICESFLLQIIQTAEFANVFQYTVF